MKIGYIVIMKLTLSIIFILFCGLIQANNEEIERLAPDIPEAKVLVESRLYLKGLYKNTTKINRKSALRVAAKLEKIGVNGCDCENLEQENMIRSQAYAVAAGIYGILSKVSSDVFLARKSYQGLSKARVYNPNNTDAIKGQAVALKMVLSKGWTARRLAAMALGINLKEAQKELIDDLREFPERADFQKLADELEAKL